MTDLVCVKCKNVKGASENLQPRKDPTRTCPPACVPIAAMMTDSCTAVDLAAGGGDMIQAARAPGSIDRVTARSPSRNSCRRSSTLRSTTSSSGWRSPRRGSTRRDLQTSTARWSGRDSGAVNATREWISAAHRSIYSIVARGRMLLRLAILCSPTSSAVVASTSSPLATWRASWLLSRPGGCGRSQRQREASPFPRLSSASQAPGSALRSP
jgi:hypothetical protein